MRTIMGVLALLVAMSARGGTTYSTDFSDLWFNPSESGWGVNVIQQQEIVFATLFHYAPNGQTTWYVGPDLRGGGVVGGSLTFSGPWYQTNGPWFGGTFNPNAVGVRQVGTATLTFNSINTGTLGFTADGVSFSRAIQRQTWRVNVVGGTYLGATIGTYSGCASGNGLSEDPASYTVTHNGGPTITVSEVGQGYTCTYSGSYGQFGRMGASAGSFTCNPGGSGTYQAYEIEASISGITARVESTLGTCRFVGRFGGLRRGP